MDVLISITGIQHVDDQKETVEMTTAGQMVPTPEGWRLFYDESAASGMEGVTTSMDIREDQVLLQRNGAMNSLLVLQKGRRHMCSYNTPYGAMMLGVYTRELRNGLTEHGGELDFCYTLDMNAGVTSSHDVHISVKEVH